MPRSTTSNIELTVLALTLLASTTPILIHQAIALQTANIVTDPGFETLSPNSWFVRSNLHNGTVNVQDNTHHHNGAYSAMLSAVNRSQGCPQADCGDVVIARIEQPTSSPPLSNLANAPDSFTAWWYVQPSDLPPYSLHIGLTFSDGSSIEYWYGQSDLQSKRYNLTSIPSIGSWFQMNRSLTADIQGVVLSPSTTTITSVWFTAYGGTYQNTTEGETAWVDDVALTFRGGPTALFSVSPASGIAPLNVTFDASQSYEPNGFPGQIIQYKWDFGDGTPEEVGSNQTTSHTYTRTGTYKVTLTVIDSNGAESNPLTTIVRVDPVDNTIPLAVTGLGATGLIAGLLFTRYRRKSRRRARQKLRKS